MTVVKAPLLSIGNWPKTFCAESRNTETDEPAGKPDPLTVTIDPTSPDVGLSLMVGGVGVGDGEVRPGEATPDAGSELALAAGDVAIQMPAKIAIPTPIPSRPVIVPTVCR